MDTADEAAKTVVRHGFAIGTEGAGVQCALLVKVGSLATCLRVLVTMLLMWGLGQGCFQQGTRRVACARFQSPSWLPDPPFAMASILT